MLATSIYLKKISDGGLQTIKGALERLEDIYKYPLRPASLRDSANDFPPKLAGRVELCNVNFGYSVLEPPLLADVSLVIPAGSRVALVGVSGSGKSTLGKLICGLYEPWSGEILFERWKLADLPPEEFANSVSYVDQDIFLFEGSARDNLTLWDSTVDERDLIAAARDALIHHDLAARPGNYDCLLIPATGFVLPSKKTQNLKFLYGSNLCAFTLNWAIVIPPMPVPGRPIAGF